ncbi:MULTISPECIES: Rv2578c family radical SAM protein [unclassified Nesterenkonia]|uniref:Rv2578c family radical SAM protein n=1 Tax=unclassified Nesterenkonia TaxID=2629769 RepID=UPI001F4C968C|nr:MULTISPECIES: Rv2578c family radical SAM protein [unclassified Nesterenkonia]MCH8561118.1 Rv2578c family radical SAM protein [Nesterenkonia sp. DZ6]MCH8562581.1 Rv2578c family radical SAM protein [Nesterenkonia sp. YGD6]
MRWQGQAVQEGEGAALIPLKGLLRSVRTPEFEGVTFHEVAAKTALNKVPGQSNMPFSWTVNPTRGCLHQCVYCLSPETLILMADGRQKLLREVRVGDVVVGTELDGRNRRLVRSEVSAKWGTEKPAFRITLRDGTQIVASGDHRFLAERGWKYVARPEGGSPRPCLTEHDRLMGFGLGMSPELDSEAEESPLEASVLGGAVGTTEALRITGIEALGRSEPLIDITTSTGDFIANGVVSHNCFARKTHEYLDLDAGRDFDTQIIVKTNVAEVLRAELNRPSWKREHVALGTNTDPYQRAEGRYQLMPGIIRALADSGTPFSILTKGPLLKRDLPLLQEAAKQVPVSVAVSLAVMDPELQQKVEPGTPDPRARLNLIRSITDAGLECSVLAMPILPWLTDGDGRIDTLHAALADAGASYVTTGALHLRPGAREWFMAWLAREYPALVAKYRRIYGGGSYASKEYRHWLADSARAARRRHGFDKPVDLMWRERNDPDSPVAQQGASAPTAAGPAQPALF